MSKFKKLKEISREIVWMADMHAINLYHPFLKRYQCIADISNERWDYFITIACVWVALEQLKNESISKKEIIEISKIIQKSLKDKYPKGSDTLVDCTEFMIRDDSEENIRLDDLLGCWIVWNLYGRKDLNENEIQLTRALGGTALRLFDSYWSQKGRARGRAW